MTAILLSGPNTMAGGNRPTIVPQQSHSPDLAVAPNFERFDGLGQPRLDHPATFDDGDFSGGGGAMYGWDGLGRSPRPGQSDQPIGQVYTDGALVGVTGTIGGQPLPVRDWKFQFDGRDGYTGAIAPTIQFRQGVGQRGPSELGAAQTTALAMLTNNPPEPGSLDAIIAGVG
jgi:hypothetical protein